MADFKDKKILILGLSITGVSAAKFLTGLGAKCYVSELSELDTKKQTENAQQIKELEDLGVKIEFGSHSKEFIGGSNLVVTSPGIPPDAEIFKILKAENIEFISDVELVHRFLKNKNASKILSITGTNGKTTTTMLLSHVLSGDFCAPYCGNVGISPCEFLTPQKNKPDFLICEVSSFQMHYSPTFSPEIAIFTNLTPDHIYFHGSFEEYFNAKAKMFKNMDKSAHAILNLDDTRVADLAKDLKCKIYFFSTKTETDGCIKNNALYFKNEKIIDIKDVPIVGEHNLQNALCAIIAAKILNMDNEKIAEQIKTFKAPEHRCEFVTEFNGIKFYNDSKATNPEATIVALKSFGGANVCLIAGGRDKNTTLEEFCEVVKKTMKSVILIGEAADRFETELKKSGFNSISRAETLEGAIDLAEGEKPDVVLLSPAAASFDMFKSFEHRGEEFKKYVQSKRPK